MAKRAKRPLKPSNHPQTEEGYDKILDGISDVLEAARRASARSVNSIMTLTYWEIGRRIVEFEQSGESRAEYGTELLKRLSGDLTERFGRGFSRQNLQNMRLFYECWPICQTMSGKSEIPGERLVGAPKRQTLPGVLSSGQNGFPLPWSHYVRLLSVKNTDARQFYEQEAIRGGWSIRQLDRQINSQFYERTALSKNRAAMLKKGQQPKAEDLVTAEQEVKDPYVLEFLDLKDEYSENELEAALIAKLESFLLELGGDFTFVGRQRRLR
ncbi:MAG: DUF1016 family protein, partial [Planctomycetaceae bacterium]|nr:DUF1016 family protein [Planctomycetaceae bacterium]